MLDSKGHKSKFDSHLILTVKAKFLKFKHLWDELSSQFSQTVKSPQVLGVCSWQSCVAQALFRRINRAL